MCLVCGAQSCWSSVPVDGPKADVHGSNAASKLASALHPRAQRVKQVGHDSSDDTDKDVSFSPGIDDTCREPCRHVYRALVPQLHL